MKRALKYIDENVRNIFNNSIFIFVSALLGFFFFHKPVELFLNKIFVEYFFSKVESSTLNDIIWVLILVVIFLFYFSKRKHYVVSKNVSLSILSSALIYGYYRFLSSCWCFTPFSHLQYVKYADVIFILAFGNTLLWIKNYKVNNLSENGAGAFFDDEPLGRDRNDELGYSKYSEILAQKIKSSNFDKAFAIGINGKWGLGKTSFIDLLKREIIKDKLLIIDFSPWNSQSPKAIIKDFFETIQEAIRPYHSSLARLLVLYADKLVSINDNKITQSIQTSIAAFTGYGSLNSIFKDINEALKKVNKKIVVFIDDLDRLDSEEIIEVIRLIRNTANFHNTFFIVAYDRNYVVKALHQHNSYNHEQFLEKIFQIEITLPYFKRDIFRQKLFEKLERSFPKKLFSDLKTEVMDSINVNSEYLNSWLESMRDVTRLANALTLNLTKLIGEVDLNDFIRLEILRLKFPSVYELLFKRTGDFFEYNKNQNRNTFKLRKFNNVQQEIPEEEFRNAKTHLEYDLLKNHLNLSVPKNSIEKVVAFIDEIFHDSFSYSFYTRSHLSVVHPSRFNLYFSYNLLEGNLSEIQFKEALTYNQNELNAKIKKWIDQGIEYELKKRFKEIKGFDNKDDFEKIVRSIFYMANLPRMKEGFFEGNLIEYDINDFEDKVSDYNNKISENIYGNFGGKEGLRIFIRGLFNSANSPYLFESGLISHLNSQLSDSFPLTKIELKEITLTYFKNFCNQTAKYDKYVYRLFHNCKETEMIPTGEGSYMRQESMPDEAKDIIKEYILKDLDGFIVSWIQVESLDQMKFSVSNFPSVLFGNWKLFEEYLIQQDESKWKYLNEFKQFFSAFKEKNFNVYISFTFNNIPIKEKLRSNL